MLPVAVARFSSGGVAVRRYVMYTSGFVSDGRLCLADVLSDVPTGGLVSRRKAAR